MNKVLRYGLSRMWAPMALRSCDEVGSGARVRGWPAVENMGRIEIGKGFALYASLARSELYAGKGGELIIGDDVFVNHGCVLSASYSIRIGDRVQLAPGCTVIDNDFHGVDARDQRPKMAPIVIEDDAWLGTRVVVLKGVRIGRGAVIAAGAVVTRDVPAGVLAGGVPAKVIRPLVTAAWVGNSG